MNILIFGPNGSGKGAQSTLIKAKLGLQHVEVGDLFREQIQNKTPLGLQVKDYIGRGDLVPDGITIPMVLNVVQNMDSRGWLLDGFPRNVNQAESLYTALHNNGIKIDYVIELTLDRVIARNRILGRRTCTNSSHHPNNTNVKEIAPLGDRCRICESLLKTRADDQDEDVINKRHDIYYDQLLGTLAAASYFKKLPDIKYISIKVDRAIGEISEELLNLLNF